MKLKELATTAIDKSKFVTLSDYFDFADQYLDYVASNLQAVIVSQNENHYQFYQYGKDGYYQITRPINSELMYSAENFSNVKKKFLDILKKGQESECAYKERLLINRAVYTLQTSIGSALDALPAGKSNVARKLNGDLFEHLIRLILNDLGIECHSGVVQVPVKIRGKEKFTMGYQHDLIVEDGDKIKLIGSIKTSSKDRIDKIFIDKFLYNKLTATKTPHIAVFLNDVQRKNTKTEGKYGINATFLPGHFKGYTIKLNPLDGVYYCDIRPNMKTEKILKRHIKTFDHLICEDIWKLV